MRRDRVGTFHVLGLHGVYERIVLVWFEFLFFTSSFDTIHRDGKDMGETRLQIDVY